MASITSAEVVRRNVRRHSHGDALRSVDQQVRKTCRQHDGLNFVAVVVGNEVDRSLIDPVEQGERERSQAALGVAHRCRTGVWSRGPKVPMAVDKRVSKAEILGHAGKGVVDRRCHHGDGTDP